MTNEKPTNPSHGELLDDFARLLIKARFDALTAGELDKLDRLRSLILGKMGEGAEAYRLLGESYLREQAARTQLAEAELRVEEARKILDETRALARAAGLKAKVDVNGWLLGFINERAEAEKRASHFLYIYHDHSLGYEQFWVMLKGEIKGKREEFLLKRFAEKGPAEEFLAEFNLASLNTNSVDADALNTNLPPSHGTETNVLRCSACGERMANNLLRACVKCGNTTFSGLMTVGGYVPTTLYDIKNWKPEPVKFSDVKVECRGDEEYCDDEIAEAIRQDIYNLWVNSRKSSRTDFGTASFQSLVRNAVIKRLTEQSLPAQAAAAARDFEEGYTSLAKYRARANATMGHGASQGELLRHLTKPSLNCTSEPDSDYSDGETPGPKEQE